MHVRIVPAVEGMEEAVARLQAGALVAFPTETVYGLGADARSAAAVGRIFEAKGRPASNPVIVHVSGVAAARELAARWPENAELLGQRFWPGPLTLVVERTDAVCAQVAAGGPTVGLRVPSHRVALRLLERSGVPVAAPSANRSEEVSPTTAAHVAESLEGFVDDLLILDGGPCAVGVESTVVDVTGAVPRVLRPGMIGSEDLVAVVGSVLMGAAEGGPARSPGQRARHYAPRKPVVFQTDVAQAAPGDVVLSLNGDPARAAQRLYAELRRLDHDPAAARIVVAIPPETPAWAALYDRLRRAAVPGE